MLITDTAKITRFVLCVVLSCLIFPLSPGCSETADMEQAKKDLKQSEEYYQKAIGIYQRLLETDKDKDRINFELGSLYFERGNFEQAISTFKNSQIQGTQKLIGISYYRLGSFTDALEAFNRQENPDDECLYYRGLTCEKLNLFEQALESYKKIKENKLLEKARLRIEGIEKQGGRNNIKDVDPEAFKIISQSSSEENYPQAGALILLADEKIELTPQNTQVSQMHYMVKILNERGKDKFSESHVDYDSTYEKVELIYARTIKPDGTIADVGSRHIRDVSKYLNFPLYSNARVYIISFPEIAEGAVIDYKIKIYRNHLINKKDFVLSYPVQTDEPVIKQNFNLFLPKGKVIHIEKINERYNDFKAELSPSITESKDSINYSWNFSDIPQIIPEPSMPPAVEVNPTVIISTFNDWKEIYDWWWKLAKDKIKADASIKEKVRDLLKGQKSQEDKARKIYNFCAKQIRYVAVEYGQAGYEPHSAQDTFRNKYGDCKDKAILLVTMMREAGLACWPVLISTDESYNLRENFPSVLFNHAIAATMLGNKLIFLDATAETCSFGDLPSGDQDRKVLLFKEDNFEIQKTPLLEARHNLIKQKVTLKIKQDGSIFGQRTIDSTGVYDQAQRYWLLYTQPQLIVDKLKERIQDFSVASVLEEYAIENVDDLDKHIRLSYSFKGPEYLTSAGPLRIMPQLAAVDTSLIAKDRRRYPFKFNYLDTKELDYAIALPDNFSVKFLPDRSSAENPWFNFVVDYSVKDNIILFRQISETKIREIAESEYPDFKKSLEELAKSIKQRIVLERK